MSVYYDKNCHLPKKNHFENADRQTDTSTDNKRRYKAREPTVTKGFECLTERGLYDGTV